MRSVLLDIPTNHYFSEVNALEAFFELLWGVLMFFVMLMLVAAVVLYIIFSISKYGMFRKARKPGWYAWVPVWSDCVLCSLLYENGLWFLFLYLPVVGVFVWWFYMVDLCRSYGKPYVFWLGLWIFPMIFLCILGFDKEPYHGISRTHPFAFREFKQPCWGTEKNSVPFEQ